MGSNHGPCNNERMSTLAKHFAHLIVAGLILTLKAWKADWRALSGLQQIADEMHLTCGDAGCMVMFYQLLRIV